MPTIAWIGSIRIMMYLADHGRPHIHAVGPDGEAKIEIHSRTVIKRRGISNKELRIVLKFITENEATLMEAWKDAQD